MIFFSQSNIPLQFSVLNHLRFLLNIIYLAQTYRLQKDNWTLLVATDKNGREVIAEMPTYMFMSCEENAYEYHNLKVSNINFV